MKDIVVYLSTEKYLKSWLEYTFGSPVRFPKMSYENELLHRNLTKRRSSDPIGHAGPETVAIVIPDSRYHKPEFYNYLPLKGQYELLSAIKSLFMLTLWSQCLPLIESKSEVNKGIENWCTAHGIDLDGYDTVRQRFYRMRANYRKYGVIIGKIYSKKVRNPKQKTNNG